MRSRIPISIQNDLILKLKDLNGSSEIASFESGLKDQSSIILSGGKVKRQKVHLIVFWIEGASESWFLLVVYYFIEEGVHEDDDLNIFFDGLFQDVGLWLVDWLGLLVFGL